MLSIPMGKLDFPHSGNRVQKTFILSTQMHYFSDFLRERQWLHLGKQSRNGTGIPERAKLSWSPRKPRFSKTGISVRKSFVFCRWARRGSLKNVVLEQYFTHHLWVHSGVASGRGPSPAAAQSRVSGSAEKIRQAISGAGKRSPSPLTSYHRRWLIWYI